MNDFTNWLGEITEFESLKPSIQKRAEAIKILIIVVPTSTLPYIKRVLGMHPKNKKIQNPEYWQKSNVISAYVQEYTSTPNELINSGHRCFDANKLSVYLATRTRFYLKWKEYLNLR
jgi:hypothetical protein